jgi:hypothetical protein
MLLPPLFALLLLGVVRLGRYLAAREQRQAETPRQWKIGPFEGSLLGMLALMFGFTFAMTAGNYREAQNNFDREAQALVEVYRWSRLLPEDDRQWLQAKLREYVDRLPKKGAADEATRRVIESMQEELWEGLVARRTAAKDPRSFEGCLNAVNRSFLARHLGYYLDRRRLPGVVVLFILSATLLVGFLVGYSSELADRHFAILAALFVVFVGATIYTIWDLDRPSEGLIVANRDDLRELSQWLQRVTK